jgi:hypothetical protein
MSFKDDIPSDDAGIRDTIRDAFGRAAFLCEWADAAEEAGENLSGCEIDDIAPADTPQEYLQWADTSIAAIEKHISMSMWEAFRRATLVPAIKTWEQTTDPLDDDDAATFGHYVAMEFMGHGVSWSDSHPDLPFSLPHREEPHCFLTGELDIVDFLD